MDEGWNHNVQYHPWVLASLPSECARVLDVGCGLGGLTRQLALRCGAVTGIDVSADMVRSARVFSACGQNVEYVVGDVMTFPFAEGSFDAVTAVATLHHLPLRPALERLGRLLKPGGVLAVVGLYRVASVNDAVWAAAGMVASMTLRGVKALSAQAAPMMEPQETLSQIREAALGCLPTAEMRRRLLFRYTLAWTKPG